MKSDHTYVRSYVRRGKNLSSYVRTYGKVFFVSSQKNWERPALVFPHQSTAAKPPTSQDNSAFATTKGHAALITAGEIPAKKLIHKAN